jgi:acetyltransferase-like isoleucine patch superfamily enzyme
MQAAPRRAINRILQLIARFGPGAANVRPFLHRLRGVRMGKKVWIGEDVILENNYPDQIEIGDETQIVMQTLILTHFRGTGKVVIGPKVWIGARATITCTPGKILNIGEGAMIGACSYVSSDVPPYTFVAGVPAKPKAKLTVPMLLETSFEEFRAGIRPLETKK